MRLRDQPPTVGTDDLVAALLALSPSPPGPVMVHLSLRRIGAVVGGPRAVVAALDRWMGPTGTWMMVLGADDPFDWVHSRPEPEHAALLSEAPPFDALSTPAQPDVGWFAEVFRRAPGTRVSDHPEGRFGARGPAAERLLRDVPWHHYYGSGSPLERFVDEGGQVLRLGADPETVTLIHYAEYLAQLPAKRRVRRSRKVVTDGRSEIRTVECLDDSDGIVDLPGEDYFARIWRAFVASGAVREGRVGGAKAEICEAGALVPFATRWLEAHLGGEPPFDRPDLR